MAKGDLLILKSDSGQFVAMNPERVVFMSPAYAQPDTHTRVVMTGGLEFVVEGTFNWVVGQWRSCRGQL